MKHVPPIRRTAAALAAFILLVSCATPPAFAPDPAARAPQLSGFGSSAIDITTRVPAARELFNQGVLQAYAFNEREAVRFFKAALARDPRCAMCAWGVAWQLGPNINDTDRDHVNEALQYVDLALRNIEGATARERALVQSLALRYAHASQARETAPLTAGVCGQGKDDEDKVHPLDAAYADRMRALADAYPGDPDILSLYAEAELIATPGSTYWSKSGKPAGRIGEATARIERLLPAHTGHTGLNHYLIHLADAVVVAPRALAAAERLGKLAPQSPHLVHMPGHIYVHVGRYDDAWRTNRDALAAESAVAAQLKAQDFKPTKDWRGHNTQFLWYAALMAGREDAALDAAAQLGALVKGATPFAEYVHSLPLVTLVRMERWDRILKEPRPAGDNGLAEIWYEHARGVALARLGRVADSQAALARLEAAAASTRAKFADNSARHKNIRAQVAAAEGRLQAEVALARRQFDQALALQAKVIKAAARLDDNEPPTLGDGTRLALGEMQGVAGRWKEAEATYREALAEHPGSGWALRGLVQSLRAQGRTAEAQAAQRDLQRSWSQASPHLRAAG
jgi:tetratricopeptide (TPR) repeat protein